MEAPQTKHKSPITYRPDIDGLRAVAVLSVFLYHAYPAVIRGGFVGVDVFFVISGFLISAIIFTQLNDGSFSFWNFYSRRIRRIYPILITVLLSCFVFAACFLVTLSISTGIYFVTPSELQQIGKHIAAGAGFVSNIVLWMESGYFDTQSVLKPLLHLWAIGIEEQFYIFWPFFLWAGARRRWNMPLLCSILFIFSFGYNLYEYRTDLTADFYSPLTRFWELIAGTILAWIVVHKNRLKENSLLGRLAAFTVPESAGRKAQIISTAGFVLLVVSIAVIRTTSSRGYPGAWALLPVAATLLILSAGGHGWFNRYVLESRICVWVGKISYPLFLWHWPMIAFGYLLTREKHLPSWYPVVVLAVSVVLSWLTTRFIEHPLRFGDHAKAKTVGLFIAMAVLGAGAFFGAKALARLNSDTPIAKVAAILDKYKNGGQAEQAGTRNDKNRTASAGSVKPEMVVLGDSHAAHLQAGLNTYFGDKFTVSVRAHPACLPIEKQKEKSCKGFFRQDMAYVAEHKPSKVILSGKFSLNRYGNNWKNLKSTIDTLRSLGVSDIVIIGQAPSFKSALPNEIILAHRRLGNPNAPLPKRIKNDLSNDIENIGQVRASAAAWGVPYISPVDVLCDENGCVAFATDDPSSVTTLDQDHLTPQGSQYLMSKLKNHQALQPKNAR